METAFSLLKNCLKLAAKAASAILGDLLVIPNIAEDINVVNLSAHSEERKSGKEPFVKEGQSDQIVQACSKLQNEILDLVRELESDQRTKNL